MTRATSSELPPGWAQARLNELVRIIRQRVMPSEHPRLSYVGMDNIEPHTMRLLGTVPADTMTSSAVNFLPGDVIYGRLRPYLNKVLAPDFEGLCSAEFIPMTPYGGVLPKFIQYRLNAADFVSFASHLNEGDRPRVSFDQIGPYPVALPPTTEQRRIISTIESYFSRLDDAEASLERVQRNLERYRASVLQAAVEGRLVPTETELARRKARDIEPAHVLLERLGGDASARPDYIDGSYPLVELPEGWCWAELPQLAAQDGFITDGDWVESKDQDPAGEIRLTQLADIGDGVFRNRSSRYLTEAKAADLGCTLLKAGDLLVSRMADPLGRACIFPGVGQPAVTAVDVCIVRLGSSPVSNRWLMHFINAPPVRKQILARQAGSTRGRISRKNLCMIPIPVPPVAEQERLAQEVDRLLSLGESVTTSVVPIESRIVSLRQSILAIAFRGQLADQDPMDEPASVLLDRLRAERAKAGSSPETPRRRGRPRKAVKK